VRRDAIVELIEVKPVTIADIREVSAEREEAGGAPLPSRPVPVRV
jgi:hypothetical protein